MYVLRDIMDAGKEVENLVEKVNGGAVANSYRANPQNT
jgi:hypothetical protein